jgi:hypothetical protein
MCIGVTLQELKLRTIFRKAQKEIASSESSDQNEESNPDSIQDDQTEQIFFDRTAKGNRGKPL